MLDKLEHLWECFEGNAYNKVASLTFKRWTTSAPQDKQFLEKAVDLLAEFQKQPMRNIKDSWEWLEHLRTSGIDLKKYLTWVDEQYELLAREKRKGFNDITLEKALNSLHTANWKDANDESAIVNSYLLNTEASLQPKIYLGSLGSSHLAVRVNSECVRPQEADSQTAESLGVTAINSKILLGMRYKILKGGKLIKLLFIPIGNVFRMKSTGDEMNTSIFGRGDWKDTGISLMLRIVKNKGTPGDFYMVKDLRSANTNVGEDDATLWENLGTDPFTLARVEDNFNLFKRLSFQNILNPALKLKKLSISKVEFVQTGEKGDWSEGHPPVGLY